MPTAITTRPQLASSPAIAVLTKGELAIDIAMRCALRSLSAPVTVISISFCAPSPSRTTSIASWRHRSASAARKASAPGLSSPVSAALPALPVAKARTVSLVEVSPSTVMHEKVLPLAADRAACRKAGSTAASVKMNPSIVAISGAIIPEPLMMPTSVTLRPSTIAVVTAPLG